MNCTVSYPVLSTNDHFRTTFYVELCYLRELCVPEDLKNECEDSSLVSSINGYFKTIFQVELSHLEKFCLLEDLSNEHTVFSSSTNEQLFQDHLPNKITGGSISLET